jgi:SAM-dependent methyltransferase
VSVGESCPICGAPGAKPLTGYGRAHLVRCRRCGMTFAGRPPTDDELGAHYADYGHAWLDSPITRERYRELLDSFEPYRVTNRLFDSGCGAGYFLEEARARGWEAHGSEYGDHALQICHDKGLEVVQAPLARDTYPPGHFDVITAFEVVEHLREPRAEADVLAHALRVGGLLYCTTPNFNSASRRVLRDRWSVISYPEHLLYFTPRTLRAWLDQAGLRPVRVETAGVSLARLRSGLAGGAEAAVSPAGDERVRATIERSALLRRAKSAVNGGLSALGVGDTLKARFERRPEPARVAAARATRRSGL